MAEDRNVREGPGCAGVAGYGLFVFAGVSVVLFVGALTAGPGHPASDLALRELEQRVSTHLAVTYGFLAFVCAVAGIALVGLSRAERRLDRVEGHVGLGGKLHPTEREDGR